MKDIGKKMFKNPLNFRLLKLMKALKCEDYDLIWQSSCSYKKKTGS